MSPFLPLACRPHKNYDLGVADGVSKKKRLERQGSSYPLLSWRAFNIYIYIRNALGVCSCKILSGRNETCHICSEMASNSLPTFVSSQKKKDDSEENILNVVVLK